MLEKTSPISSESNYYTSPPLDNRSTTIPTGPHITSAGITTTSPPQPLLSLTTVAPRRRPALRHSIFGPAISPHIPISCGSPRLIWAHLVWIIQENMEFTTLWRFPPFYELLFQISCLSYEPLAASEINKYANLWYYKVFRDKRGVTRERHGGNMGSKPARERVSKWNPILIYDRLLGWLLLHAIHKSELGCIFHDQRVRSNPFQMAVKKSDALWIYMAGREMDGWSPD